MSELLTLFLIVSASAFVHESGHALAALAVGWRIDGLALRWYGVFLRVEAPDDPPVGTVAKVAAGGLLATALLAALCYLLAPLGIIFWMLGALNVGLLCFNLIPLRISDGGYLWRALR